MHPQSFAGVGIAYLFSALMHSASYGRRSNSPSCFSMTNPVSPLHASLFFGELQIISRPESNPLGDRHGILVSDYRIRFVSQAAPASRDSCRWARLIHTYRMQPA